mgnify:CR=1 FL=1|tara:strand:- start:9314 stop:9523 length:210 start_codon:yes stop_codon:yes gene_type:complete
MEAHIECDSCYELRVKRIKEEKFLTHFKDGVASGLIDGVYKDELSDNKTNAYKQGYDFGLWLHSEIKEE